MVKALMALSGKVLILTCSLFLLSCEEESPLEQGDALLLWQSLPNEKIVFTSKADSPEGELYLLEKDGSIERLTYNTRHENNPALSQDRSKVAFHGGNPVDPLTWEIFTLDLETGFETQLTDNSVIDAHPDWSPDGSQIVFGSFRNGSGNAAGTADIYRVNIDSGELTRLTTSPWEDNDPEYSPDGTQIVFKSNRVTQIEAREEIFIMDSDGGNVQRLTVTSGWQSDHDPSWSPDGQVILFSRYDGSRPWTDMANVITLQNFWDELIPWNIFRVTTTGLEEQLSDVAFAAGLPVYSLDEANIVYLQLEYIISNGLMIGAYHRLILVDSDGTNSNLLLEDNEHTGTLEYWDW